MGPCYKAGCSARACPAGQAGLKLTRFSCFVGVQKMDKAPKSPTLREDLLREAKEVAGRGVAPDLVVSGNG